MDFILLYLLGQGVNILGGLYAAKEEERAAKLDARQIEANKKLNDAAVKQQTLSRLEEYDLAVSANIAAFAAAGRSTETQDVQAFLERNRKIVGTDIGRVQTQAELDGVKAKFAAATERERGKNAVRASLFDAAGKVGQTGLDYYRIK